MIVNNDPEQVRCRLETAEDRLLRSLEIAEAVTKACEARGVAVPGAVAMADRELQLSLFNWQEKLKDYRFVVTE